MNQKKYPRIINGASSPLPVANFPKFWNMATISDSEAEITMYGEIVSSRPVDWWTGEPIPGMFISPEGFLEDLALVRDKANITIRINSIGGDLYTGLAIFTQLKSLAGKKTVIIDGIAASAASVIAMAGNIIKIPTSSLFMIHDPSVFLYDYYNNKAINDIIKMLDASASSAAEAYATKTKMDTKAIRTLMTKETWMTGREAVDQGFADEVLFEDNTKMSMSADKTTLMVNGIMQSIKGYHNMPGNIPVQNSVPAAVLPPVALPPADKNINQGGNEPMYKTIEELRQACPDLAASLETAAKAQGVTEERDRLKGIEDIASAIGDAELINNAKYGDKPCSAQDLAFSAMQKQAKLGTQHLANQAADNAASGANDVNAQPNSGLNANLTGSLPSAENAAAEASAVAMIVGANKKQ